MKKEIIDALTAKFEGVDAAIIGRIADKLAKTATTSELVKSAVEAFTLQQLLTSYGDSRATEATLSAVKNYETKYGLKDGVKKAQDGEGNEGAEGKDPKTNSKKNEGDDIATAIANAVAAAMKPLQDEIVNLKQGRVTETRKQKFGAIVGKLPETMRKGYNRINVADMTDEDFTTLLSEAAAEVDAIVSETKARGAVMGRPMGKGGNEASKTGVQQATDAEAKEVVERLHI